LTDKANKKSRLADLIIVSLIAVVAIALRLEAISYRGEALGWDEYMYLVLGRHLLTGQGYQLFGLPNITFTGLVPIIGGVGWLILGSTRWALSLPSAVLGGLAVIPVFLLARRMFSRTAAFSAALIFTGLRSLLMFVPFVPYIERLYDGSEQIFLFFVMWTLYFFYRTYQTRGIISAALAGLCCGLAFQARQEALVLWMALGGWLLVSAVLIEKRLSLNLLARLAGVVVFFIVATAPYFLYARSVTGHILLGPHISHNVAVRDAFKSVYFHDDWKPYFRLHQELNLDDTEFRSPYYGVAPAHIEAEKNYSTSGTFGNLMRGIDFPSLKYWLSDMRVILPSYIVFLMFMGLVMPPTRESIVKALFLAATLAPAVAISLMLLVLPRYDLYTTGIVTVFAGAGLVTFVTPNANILRIRPATACYVVAALMVVMGAYFAREFNSSFRNLLTQHDRAIELYAPDIGEKLKPMVPRGALLMCHEPKIALAVDATWVPLPASDFPDIVAFARHKNIKYILVKGSDVMLLHRGNDAVMEEMREQAIRPFVYDDLFDRPDLVRVIYSGFADEPFALLQVVPAAPGAN